MFGRKKRAVDGERSMVIGLNSGSGANEGLTLGDVRDFVYRSMTLGVPLQAPVMVTPGKNATKVHGISVSTTDIPKPPDPSMLWPPTPAHGLPMQASPVQPEPVQSGQSGQHGQYGQSQSTPVQTPGQNGHQNGNFHDGGASEPPVQFSE